MTTGRLTADDFFTGLFAALAQRGGKSYSMRNDRFDRAIAASFGLFQETAKRQGIEVRFRIRLHALHGDSPTVRASITNAARRELISLDNPEYQIIRLKVGPEDAGQYLAAIPGGPEMYAHLADEFLKHYEHA